MNVEGKVILITGGASGIGFGVAKKLFQSNAKGVAIVDKKITNEAQEELETLSRKDSLICITADITNEKQFEDAFEKTVNFFKQLDIVFNNAGITNEQDWEKMLNVNLIAVIRGSYLAMKKYLPKYKSGEEGIIVNTASVLGLQTTQLAPVYCVTKHGVVCFGQTLNGDEFYKTYKVRILTLCPGLVKTGIQNVPVDVRLMFPHLIENERKKFGAKEQSAECVAEAFVEIVKKGRNGSVWVVENEEPVYEVVNPKKYDLQRLPM